MHKGSRVRPARRFFLASAEAMKIKDNITANIDAREGNRG